MKAVILCYQLGSTWIVGLADDDGTALGPITEHGDLAEAWNHARHRAVERGVSARLWRSEKIVREEDPARAACELKCSMIRKRGAL